MDQMEMNVGLLRQLIASLPDDMPVFAGCQGYCNYDFKRRKPVEHEDTFAIVHNGKLFITDSCAIEDENGKTI